jgi:hypothetical protein
MLTKSSMTLHDEQRRYEIFISHSTRLFPDQLELARYLNKWLSNRGFYVFLDQMDLDNNPDLFSLIEDIIKNACVGVVLMTRKSLASAWVRLEMQMMQGRQLSGKMRIIALRLEPECGTPQGINFDSIVEMPDESHLSEAVKAIINATRNGSLRSEPG